MLEMAREDIEDVVVVCYAVLHIKRPYEEQALLEEAERAAASVITVEIWRAKRGCC